MERIDMVNTVGRQFQTTNTENGEFSYKKFFKGKHIPFDPISNKDGRKFETIDLRFEKDGISVLIETKQNFQAELAEAEEQLAAYVEYEKKATGNKIVAVLANTRDNSIMVWRGAVSVIDALVNETVLRSMSEYQSLYSSKTNDKEKVMKNTYKLNEILHKYGINEKLRSQFVGTCLLALKNNLSYSDPKMKTEQIIAGIRSVLEDLLNHDINKAKKIVLLDNSILHSQDIKDLQPENFREILKYIEDNILPYINDKSTAGQDLLNLFFVTFNKYVGKADKNQAFTPDHITDFMSKVCGVNKHSIVLDPCCGSGSFLVRAMNQALEDCASEKEQKEIKKSHIWGIELEDTAYGLATTNMLIHSDGNSNIFQGSCFDMEDIIRKAKPTVILMNPPYNATRNQMPKEFTTTWGENKKEDPSKGFFFVKYIIDVLNEMNQPATMAVLLPVSCAIGSNETIKAIKKDILKNNSLDAVFSLPDEIFYPGASASACCMVFKIGQKNNGSGSPDTFFGYYKEDGFKKKKNLGRVEQLDSKTHKSKWEEIETKWLDAYRNRLNIDGFSVTHRITGDDEWLCEAYMTTDYSNLCEKDFEKTIRSFIAYKIENGEI